MVSLTEPAVCDSELNHRVKLFGDNCLLWIRTKYRRGERQEYREGEPAGCRVTEITESDIDLHADPSSVQTGWHNQADAFIFGAFFDSASLDSGKIEENPVFADHGADFTNAPRDVRNSAVPNPRRSRSRVGRYICPSHASKSMAPLSTKLSL